MKFFIEIESLFGKSPSLKSIPETCRQLAEVVEINISPALQSTPKFKDRLVKIIKTISIDGYDNDDFLVLFPLLLKFLLKYPLVPSCEIIYTYLSKMDVFRGYFFNELTNLQKNLVGRILLRTLQMRLRGMSNERYYKDQKCSIEKTWIKNI